MSALWTKSEETTLIAMMLEGNSAGLIAEAMGKTRNAVIGRACRLNLKWDSQICKQLGRPNGVRRTKLVRAAGCLSMQHFVPYVPVADTARAEAMLSAYELFQSGMDTEQIARLQWRTEASVHREINVERSRRIRRRNPYEAISK